jgi:hypothetical protein
MYLACCKQQDQVAREVVFPPILQRIIDYSPVAFVLLLGQDTGPSTPRVALGI